MAEIDSVLTAQQLREMEPSDLVAVAASVLPKFGEEGLPPSDAEMRMAVQALDLADRDGVTDASRAVRVPLLLAGRRIAEASAAVRPDMPPEVQERVRVHLVKLLYGEHPEDALPLLIALAEHGHYTSLSILADVGEAHAPDLPATDPRWQEVFAHLGMRGDDQGALDQDDPATWSKLAAAVESKQPWALRRASSEGDLAQQAMSMVLDGRRPTMGEIGPIVHHRFLGLAEEIESAASDESWGALVGTVIGTMREAEELLASTVRSIGALDRHELRDELERRALIALSRGSFQDLEGTFARLRADIVDDDLDEGDRADAREDWMGWAQHLDALQAALGSCEQMGQEQAKLLRAELAGMCAVLGAHDPDFAASRLAIAEACSMDAVASGVPDARRRHVQRLVREARLRSLLLDPGADRGIRAEQVRRAEAMALEALASHDMSTLHSYVSELVRGRPTSGAARGRWKRSFDLDDVERAALERVMAAVDSALSDGTAADGALDPATAQDLQRIRGRRDAAEALRLLDGPLAVYKGGSDRLPMEVMVEAVLAQLPFIDADRSRLLLTITMGPPSYPHLYAIDWGDPASRCAVRTHRLAMDALEAGAHAVRTGQLDLGDWSGAHELDFDATEALTGVARAALLGAQGSELVAAMEAVESILGHPGPTSSVARDFHAMQQFARQPMPGDIELEGPPEMAATLAVVLEQRLSAPASSGQLPDDDREAYLRDALGAPSRPVVLPLPKDDVPMVQDAVRRLYSHAVSRVLADIEVDVDAAGAQTVRSASGSAARTLGQLQRAAGEWLGARSAGSTAHEAAARVVVDGLDELAARIDAVEPARRAQGVDEVRATLAEVQARAHLALGDEQGAQAAWRSALQSAPGASVLTFGSPVREWGLRLRREGPVRPAAFDGTRPASEARTASARARRRDARGALGAAQHRDPGMGTGSRPGGQDPGSRAKHLRHGKPQTPPGPQL